jgi:hypothetical protein
MFCVTGDIYIFMEVAGFFMLKVCGFNDAWFYYSAYNWFHRHNCSIGSILFDMTYNVGTVDNHVILTQGAGLVG